MEKVFRKLTVANCQLSGFYDDEEQLISVMLRFDEGEILHSQVQTILAKAYIAKSLGFDVYEDDSHWAFHLELKRQTFKLPFGTRRIYMANAQKIVRAKELYEKHLLQEQMSVEKEEMV